ncbi:hypothetical protein DFA_05905 [Cavenderia fasciculata]|uniref:Uncharacterized protein n=1 Tax=Cavenderia fasciculata TaxID=261658 RepID=F4PJJ6_CACFS|nr:uncharacterized protein DFA_05905 [Cavenderia fasciculata]EGG23770.1 hypothetical protein DFA_05905 [Cavenderia fasciculata]|eukprot:XP_004361621.1 hypothetical protein DFA_05905 [Cavenderia fasciculata]
MKLILSILFVIFFSSVILSSEFTSFSDEFSADAESLYGRHKRPHHHHHHHHKCFRKAKGYTTYFGVTSFNCMFPDGQGNIKPMSFAEYGNTSVDFHGQRMRVNYYIVGDNWRVNGSLWGFGKSGEMYVLQNGTCSKYNLSFPIPSGYPVNQTHFIAKGKIGQFKVDILSVNPTPSGETNQTVLFDPKHCACVSSMLRNNDRSQPGYATIEFFDYRNDYDKHYFSLPGECSDLAFSDPSTIHRNVGSQVVMWGHKKPIVIPNYIHLSPNYF